jgi:restriction system protein
MPFPKQSDVEVPLLRVLIESGGSAKPQAVYPKVAQHFPDLSPEVNRTGNLGGRIS